jgi:DNA-binding Lrp family transcriptional regulator
MIKRFEKEEIIQGYCAIPNLDKLGTEIVAIVLFKLKHQSKSRALPSCQSMISAVTAVKHPFFLLFQPKKAFSLYTNNIPNRAIWRWNKC